MKSLDRSLKLFIKRRIFLICLSLVVIVVLSGCGAVTIHDVGSWQRSGDIKSLVKALGDKEPLVRAAAATALIEIGAPALPTLESVVDHGKRISWGSITKQTRIFFWSCYVLVEITGEDKYVSRIFDLLEKSVSVSASLEAMELLVALDPQTKHAVVPSLIDFAFKYHVTRYEEAGGRLASIKAANPELAPGQDTGTLWARSFVVNASIADRKALSGQALESLKRITGEDFGWDKKKWDQWWEQSKEH